MTKSYSQIQKQIKELEKQAAQLRQKEVASVIVRIKEAIAAYDLTAADLGYGRVAKASTKTKAPRKARAGTPKFRDAEGRTWGGRGPRPKWLRDALAAGKSLNDFAT